MNIYKWPIDEEIQGRLYAQALEIFFPVASEPLKGQFISLLMQVMVKLQSLKYHMGEYQKKEEVHIQEVLKNIQQNQYVTIAALDLLYELESFLFQFKSSLDLSVKFIDILFPGKFKVQTFGNKGNDLIKGLERFNKGNAVKKDTVDSIITMIREDQETWLSQAVKLRDDIAHYKTFLHYHYNVNQSGDEYLVTPPRVKGMTVLEYMNLVYQNCIEFLQDFMCLVIELHLPPVFCISSPSVIGVGEPLKKYIKFGLAHRGQDNITC